MAAIIGFGATPDVQTDGSIAELPELVLRDARERFPSLPTDSIDTVLIDHDLAQVLGDRGSELVFACSDVLSANNVTFTERPLITTIGDAVEKAAAGDASSVVAVLTSARYNDTPEGGRPMGCGIVLLGARTMAQEGLVIVDDEPRTDRPNFNFNSAILHGMPALGPSSIAAGGRYLSRPCLLGKENRGTQHMLQALSVHWKDLKPNTRVLVAANTPVPQSLLLEVYRRTDSGCTRS